MTKESKQVTNRITFVAIMLFVIAGGSLYYFYQNDTNLYYQLSMVIGSASLWLFLTGNFGYLFLNQLKNRRHALEKLAVRDKQRPFKEVFDGMQYVSNPLGMLFYILLIPILLSFAFILSILPPSAMYYLKLFFIFAITCLGFASFALGYYFVEQGPGVFN